MQTTDPQPPENLKKPYSLFNIYWPFLLAGLLLILLLIWQVPSIQNTVLSWINPDGPQVSVRSDFDAFIPYTMGYFPEDFTIKDVGVGGVNTPDYDLYQEWYTSEAHFIILLETNRNNSALPEGEAITIKDGPGVIITDPDLDQTIGELIDLSAFDTNESYHIAFLRGELKLEIFTNLPRDEALKVADLLIPSQCTQPPTEMP